MLSSFTGNPCCGSKLRLIEFPSGKSHNPLAIMLLGEHGFTRINIYYGESLQVHQDANIY